MTAHEIIRSMVARRWRESFCLPNYTPHRWWECDVFELTKAGYLREYEVKISRGDFFADAAKTREVFPRPYGAPQVFEKKHDLLAAGSPRGPSLFFYVTPPGLIELHELPLWAGLIEIVDRGADCGSYRYGENEVKPAPRLHREKVADDVRKHAASVCYYRMHGLLAAEKINATGPKTESPPLIGA